MSGSMVLADLGSNAIDLFRKVEKALKESADTAWPDDLLVAESERFELWAANMGLFVAGHGSLDYRVREAERLAQTLRRFMQDLINSLDDGKASPFGLRTKLLTKVKQWSNCVPASAKRVYLDWTKVAENVQKQKE